MNTEQRIAFNAWAEAQNPKIYPAEWQAFEAGWQAALASAEVQALREALEKLLAGARAETAESWQCNSYHPKLIAGMDAAAALAAMEKQP